MPLALGIVAVIAVAGYFLAGSAIHTAQTRGVLDDKWTAEARKYIAHEERGFEIVKIYSPEEVRGASWKYPSGIRIFVPVIPPDSSNVPMETRLKNTRAIRVEYETDEGFGRKAPHDDVFVVEFWPNGLVEVQSVDEGDFLIGK